jgi:IclR family pca regulon transcriptional regulator
MEKNEEPGEGDPHARRGVANARTRYSKSLERGLAILASFTPERRAIGVRELAQELGMSRTTTHRYVSALAALGYLRQDSERRYRLALRVTDLGLAAWNAMGLPAHADAAMRRLAERTGRTVCLVVLDGVDALVVHSVRRVQGAEPETTAEQQLTPGARGPAYCTSAGKALLAQLPAGPQARLIRRSDLVKRAPNTITTAQALEAELARVRAEGLAVSEDELAGVCAIAAPIREPDGQTPAALSIAARTSTIAAEQLVERAGGLLIATAELISCRLRLQG